MLFGSAASLNLQPSSSPRLRTDSDPGGKLKAEGLRLVYRFDWPRTIFLTFFLAEPRGVVRLALGAAFLRAARLTFLRSSLSSIFFVSATKYLSECDECNSRFSGYSAI